MYKCTNYTHLHFENMNDTRVKLETFHTSLKYIVNKKVALWQNNTQVKIRSEISPFVGGRRTRNLSLQNMFLFSVYHYFSFIFKI